jgi:hypothetical protein
VDYVKSDAELAFDAWLEQPGVREAIAQRAKDVSQIEAEVTETIVAKSDVFPRSSLYWHDPDLGEWLATLPEAVRAQWQDDWIDMLDDEVMTADLPEGWCPHCGREGGEDPVDTTSEAYRLGQEAGERADISDWENYIREKARRVLAHEPDRIGNYGPQFPPPPNPEA